MEDSCGSLSREALPALHVMMRKGGQQQLTAQNTSSTPDSCDSSSEAVTAVGGHGGLGDLERLTERGDLEHVQAGSEEQVAELDGLLLDLLRLDDGGCDG